MKCSQAASKSFQRLSHAPGSSPALLIVLPFYEHRHQASRNKTA